MSCISFFLCSVPDVEAGRRLYGFKDLADGDVVKAMEHIGRQAQGSLGPALQRVIAASMVLSHEDGFELHTLGEVGGDEKALLEAFFAQAGSAEDVLLSWNGATTMLPIVHVRALLHGIVAPDYWANQDDFDLHLDLSEQLLGLAAEQSSLEQVSSLLGLPVRDPLSAEQVEDAWAAGELSDVQAWCDQQALNSQLLFMRFQMINGGLSAEDYQTRMDLFRQELRRWDEPSLNHYADALESLTHG